MRRCHGTLLVLNRSCKSISTPLVSPLVLPLFKGNRCDEPGTRMYLSLSLLVRAYARIISKILFRLRCRPLLEAVSCPAYWPILGEFPPIDIIAYLTAAVDDEAHGTRVLPFLLAVIVTDALLCSEPDSGLLPLASPFVPGHTIRFVSSDVAIRLNSRKDWRIHPDTVVPRPPLKFPEVPKEYIQTIVGMSTDEVPNSYQSVKKTGDIREHIRQNKLVFLNTAYNPNGY